MIKTGVMRILDKSKIEYKVFDYSFFGFTNGEEISKHLNIDSKYMYKTLLTEGKSKNYYVFMLPVNKELDLKKCAKIHNEKSIEMVHQKNLLGISGYIHGGCSPLGMKKSFITVIDSSINSIDEIYFSAGKVGYQVSIKKDDLKKVLNYSTFDIVRE